MPLSYGVPEIGKSGFIETLPDQRQQEPRAEEDEPRDGETAQLARHPARPATIKDGYSTNANSTKRPSPVGRSCSKLSVDPPDSGPVMRGSETRGDVARKCGPW